MAWTLVDSRTAAFADGNAGHLFDLGAAPAAGDIDVLFVNSDTVVTTPSGWTLPTGGSQVNNQGAYAYYRIATGSEGSTVTITTSGDFNAVAGFSRWRGGKTFDVAVSDKIDGVTGATTPTISTGTLSQSNELVIAGALLHRLASPAPTSPVWSSGYTALTDVTQGTGTSGCTQYVGYKTGAGTAAESPSCTWTDGAFDRYIIVLTFTMDPGGPPQRDAADTLTLSDAAAGNVALPRAISDSVTTSDAASRATSAGRAGADSVSISDATSRTVSRPRGAADSAAVTDAVAATLSKLVTLSDTVTVADQAAAVVTLTRAPTDAVYVADASDRTTSVSTAVADALTVSDSVTRATTVSLTASDTVSVTDDASALKVFAATAADTLTLADEATRAPISYQRAAIDTLHLADVASLLSSTPVDAVDSIAMSDSAARMVTAPRVVSDAVALADAPTMSLAYAGRAVDTIAIADAGQRTVALFRNVADSVHFADTATIAEPGLDITITVGSPTRKWAAGAPWI